MFFLPISYFVPAILAVMKPFFFFLVWTFLFTPFWLDSVGGMFMGDVPWSSVEYLATGHLQSVLYLCGHTLF